MERKFILSCCSTVDLPYSYMQSRDIPVLFYTYVVDGQEYVDDMGRDPEALPRFQHKGLGQCADAQLRPLQVDEQLGDAHGVDHVQPVFVGRKGPVGKVHADARHASFHHALQGLRLGTGGTNGTIKFQKITRFRFFLL